MTAHLDLGSRLPCQLWYEEESQAHDQRFWERILAVLHADSLLTFDLGYTTFSVFVQLTAAKVTLPTHARRISPITSNVHFSPPLSCTSLSNWDWIRRNAPTSSLNRNTLSRFVVSLSNQRTGCCSLASPLYHRVVWTRLAHRRYVHGFGLFLVGFVEQCRVANLDDLFAVRRAG